MEMPKLQRGWRCYLSTPKDQCWEPDVYPPGAWILLVCPPYSWVIAEMRNLFPYGELHSTTHPWWPSVRRRIVRWAMSQGLVVEREGLHYEYEGRWRSDHVRRRRSLDDIKHPVVEVTVFPPGNELADRRSEVLGAVSRAGF